MTKNTSVSALSTKGKGKPGFSYEEIPTGEKLPGSSDRDLGAIWGLTPGRANPDRRTTRHGSRSQTIPGGLESAQKEHDGQLDGTDTACLDPSGKPDSDRQRGDLDQLVRTGSDRSEAKGHDQSDNMDSDQKRGGPTDQPLPITTGDELIRILPERASTVVPPSPSEKTSERQSVRSTPELMLVGFSFNDTPSTEKLDSKPRS